MSIRGAFEQYEEALSHLEGELRDWIAETVWENFPTARSIKLEVTITPQGEPDDYTMGAHVIELTQEMGVLSGTANLVDLNSKLQDWLPEYVWVKKLTSGHHVVRLETP